MKNIVIALILLSYANLHSQTNTKKPNIIIILTDDQGYADIGANGQVTDIKTPNIDLLAKNGVRMTDAYVTAPQCIPSRAGLITGKYQERFGVDHNGTIPLPLTEITIAQRMKNLGYTTGMAGKWHLDPNHQQEIWIKENVPEVLKNKNKAQAQDIPFSKKIEYSTSRRGFDQVFEGYINTYWTNYTLEGKDKEESHINQPGDRLEIQTNAALTFIKKNKEKPFFYYLSYFAPHVPLGTTKEYLDRFPGDMAERRRYCLAMLSNIDEGVGKIKNTLKELGIEENTLIIFLSDNGAPLKLTMEDLPIKFQGGAWDGSLNKPLVGEKGMIAEGGIRIPFIMNWPAVLPKGKVYKKPVISLDIAATCVAIGGLKTQPKELDGVNLIPYLTNKSNNTPHEALYWRFWKQSAIRMGNYKYIAFSDRAFLFDLSSIDGEKVNLISKYPEIAQKLKSKLSSWLKTLKYETEKGNGSPAEQNFYNHYFPLNP